MKTDARPDRSEEPEREELQALLRQWGAPPPPRLEDALRREFRMRRRPARPLVAWAAVAAGLALAAGLLVTLQESKGPAAAGAAAPRVAATTAPSVVTDPVAQPVEPKPERVAQAPAAARRRAARARPPARSEPEIVVEAGQAELLAQLGQKLWETRQAAPGTDVVAMPDVHAPTYRAEWQPVAGVWPQWQQSVSDMGR